MRNLTKLTLTFGISDAQEKAATREDLMLMADAIDEALDVVDVTGKLERALKDILNNPAHGIKIDLK